MNIRLRAKVTGVFCRARPVVAAANEDWPSIAHVSALADLMGWDGKSIDHGESRWWFEMISEACALGELPGRKETLSRRLVSSEDIGIVHLQRFESKIAYYVRAVDFAAWLQKINEAPSALVREWFATVGVQVESEPLDMSGAERRQAARYQACVSAGLVMPDNDYAHLPAGIGTVAKRLGITRQALAKDLKAHINRLAGK